MHYQCKTVIYESVYLSLLSNRIGVRFLNTQIMNYENNVKAFKHTWTNSICSLQRCWRKTIHIRPNDPCKNTVWSTMLLDCPFILGACVKCLLFPQSRLSPLSPREPIKNERDNELHNNKIPSNLLSVSTTVSMGTIRKERWKEEFMSKKWKRDQKGTNSRSKMRQLTFKRFLLTPFNMIKMENN